MAEIRNFFRDRCDAGAGGPVVEMRIHFIGVGGSGMYAAARMMLQRGARISGSDVRPFVGMTDLQSGGATVYIEHRSSNLEPDVQLVVVSAAIPSDNPELEEARRRMLPVLTYPQFVAELMKLRRGIAVAGTHGKSTTTALVSFLLRTAGLDPSYILGGSCPQLGGGAFLGNGPDFVVEACEFARSFLNFSPRMAAILNVDVDHLDCFNNLDEIASTFAEFANRVHPEGVVLAPHGDPSTPRLLESSRAVVETFGDVEDATWRAADLSCHEGRWSFEIRYRSERVVPRLELALVGLHNVGNALAAAALAYHAGAGSSAIHEALQTFNGVYRRLTWKGRPRGVNVVDDYAHHPRAISCTLRAAREHFKPRRTWVVFQPHQHSRTRLLMDEFAHCFDQADVVIIPDIFAARDSAAERARTGARDLVNMIHQTGADARYEPSFDEITRVLEENTQDGDLIVTMGAGDIWKVADELVGQV